MSKGTDILLVVDRPVAGGRMLARHEGGVVLVAGAIPGERVRARIERVARRVAWAQVIEVVDASPDRREPGCDPACGGSCYAHIKYDRQLQLKQEVIADAFRRIAKTTLDRAVPVESSPEHAYRLRARLHVRGPQAGFFREGTHELCDASATGQLLPESLSAVSATLDALGSRSADVAGVLVSENVAATERVLHLEPRDLATFDDLAGIFAGVDGATGLTAGTRRGPVGLFGAATVTDTADQLFRRDIPIDGSASWTRHATAFFQGNRFLTGPLLRRVLELAQGDRFVDLYAGVGLFAVALAARGGHVEAVEADRSSHADLTANARPWRDRLRVMGTSVEDVVSRPPADQPDVVIANPPRTGVSPEALRGLCRWRVPRIVYVSCDPPTLARDAAHLIGGSYHLQSLDAFDLFPNTPHVETIAVFDKS